MKRVLLTGAGGFVGRHCIAPLAARGYEVHAVSSRAAPAAPGPARWHRTDLLDAAQAAALLRELRPTHLLHLAWYAVPGRYWTAPENLHWLGASLALAEQFAACGGQRLVGAGSCAEYDWRYGYCHEEFTPLAPATLYGACKNALRGVLESYCGTAGLSAAWGRLFFLYGPHEKPERLLPSVIRALLAGQPARCTAGRQRRDFLHVADAADAFCALLDAPCTGPVNIASGRTASVREVVEAVAQRLRHADRVEFGALPERAGEPPLLAADTGRIGRELGWRPRHDLATGLDATIAWWRAELAARP